MTINSYCTWLIAADTIKSGIVSYENEFNKLFKTQRQEICKKKYFSQHCMCVQLLVCHSNLVKQNCSTFFDLEVFNLSNTQVTQHLVWWPCKWDFHGTLVSFN